MELTEHEKAVRDRLINCRRTAYEFSPQQRVKLKKMLRSGEVTKKGVCAAFHMTYKQLKQSLQDN